MFDLEESKNKVLNVNAFDFMDNVPDNFFDFIIADPNFGVTRNSWDIKTDMSKFWKSANRITNKSAVLTFSQMPFGFEVYSENKENFRYSMVWDKVLGGNGFNANRMPIKTHEDIMIFGDSDMYYNPEKTKGHKRKTAQRKKGGKNNNYGDVKEGYKYDSTERFPKTIMKFSNGGNRTKIVHPTEKPLELMLMLIRMYTKSNFKVYIPFCGSGVDTEACKSLGLDFWGTELEKDYCEIIDKRLSQVQRRLF